MKPTITSIKNRIRILEVRDAMGNYHLIQKLKRKLRKLES